MRKLLALMLFATLSAQAQIVVRNNYVPDVTLTRDLGSEALWFDSAYVNVYRGTTLSLTGNASVGGTLGVTGTVTLSNLTASRLVATDGSKVLVSTITAANLLASVTGTTGTGDLVFDTAPDFATSLSMGGTQWMDASRNLSNIGTLSSGAITASGQIKTTLVGVGFYQLTANSGGNIGAALENTATRATDNAAILALSLTDNTTDDFLIRHRQTSASDNASQLEIMLPSGATGITLDRSGTLSSGAITASGLIRTDRTGVNATIDGSNYSLFLRNNTTDAWTTMYFSDGITYDGYIGMFGSATSASRLVKINHNGADDIYFDGNNDAFIPNGSLTVAGNLILSANIASNLIPNATDTYDIGSAKKLWSQSFISQMNAVVFAENVIQVIGGWFYVAKDQGTLPAVAAADVTIDFGKAMTVGDFIVIRAHDASGAIKAEYIEIGSLISGTNYNVTRDLAGAHVTDPVWADGTPYVALGQTGNGRIELNANDTPRMSMIVQGATYNAQTEMLRVGDLNGNWGYVAPTYGFAAGEYAAGENSLTIDQTNGIRFFGGTDVVGQLSATTWTLGDTANEHVNLTATALQFKDGATVLTDISGGNVTIGEVGASKYNLYVSGGTAYFRNNVTAIVTIGPAAG